MVEFKKQYRVFAIALSLVATFLSSKAEVGHSREMPARLLDELYQAASELTHAQARARVERALLPRDSQPAHRVALPEPGECWQVTSIRLLRDDGSAESEEGTQSWAEPETFTFEVIDRQNAAVILVQAHGHGLIEPGVNKFAGLSEVESPGRGYAWLNKGRAKGVAIRVTRALTLESDAYLGAFPLTVPVLERARFRVLEQRPTLPRELRLYDAAMSEAWRQGRHFELLDEDFLGRPLRAVWRPESFWPLLVETESEVALVTQRGRCR